MQKLISITILLSLTVTTLWAVPRQVVAHGRSFSLSRTVVIVASRAGADFGAEVAKILEAEGVTAKIIRGRVTTKARIIVERSRSIPQAEGSDALQITVSPDVVTIRYTTAASRERAIYHLRKIVSDRTIQGYNIIDWGGAQSPPRSLDGVIDAARRFVPLGQIETTARNTKNSKQLFVQMVDQNDWRIESEIFITINPREEIYPKNGRYTPRQISELATKLERQERIKLIPTIDLMTPNIPFRTVTGHELNSVEGMRFIRAFIEDFVQKTNCRTICVGTWSDSADKRYVEFLNDLATHNNIELIYR